MRIRWLHLSDIHFNFKNYNSHSLRQDFLQRIESLAQTEPFTHLFITGDILYCNKKADEDTIKFVKDLIAIMNIEKDQVIIVPGNHDHNRDISITVLEELYSSQKNKTQAQIIDELSPDDISNLMKSYDNFCDAYSRIFADIHSAIPGKPHSIISSDELSIIKLDTSWLDVNSDQENDYLRIGTRQLQLLLTDNAEKLGEIIRIAVGHHSLDDMLPEERNRVLDQFRRHSVVIYLCGHKHKPKIHYYKKYDVVEFVAPGGYIDDDGYSSGGYALGTIDTDADFYQAEIYRWNENNWYRETMLQETDENGMYYFETKKLKHNHDIVAIDFKTMGGHIPRRELERSLGTSKFDHIIYRGNEAGEYTKDSITNLANEISVAIEHDKTVHIYPLAQIPMLIFLGFEIQNNYRVNIHQLDRATQVWKFNESFENTKLEPVNYQLNGSKRLAVSISTSAEVTKEQVDEAMGSEKFDCICFKTKTVDFGTPLYTKDVCSILNEIMKSLDSYRKNYDEIHIFAAIPAGMAVELGRRMLSSVYCNIHTYQFSNGSYAPNWIINPK